MQRDIEALEAALEKLKEYEKKLHICENRGSYAKTDPDATFMHMKDDHMLNGQLKPAYNIQHAVNSGFIVAAGIFPNPTDVMTLKPFLNQMEEDLSFTFGRVVCDAGYESEENLSFLRTKRIEAYIKPANYEQIGTKKFAKEIGRKENMQYDKEKDCYRSDFIFALIRAIGIILLGLGIMQVGLSLKSHDPSQRANGFLTLAGGIVITFTKEILNLIIG